MMSCFHQLPLKMREFQNVNQFSAHHAVCEVAE